MKFIEYVLLSSVLLFIGCATTEVPLPVKTEEALAKWNARSMEEALKATTLEELMVAYRRSDNGSEGRVLISKKWDTIIQLKLKEVDPDDVWGLIDLLSNSRQESEPWKEIRSLLKPHFNIFWEE